jgi:hypothetical protein
LSTNSRQAKKWKRIFFKTLSIPLSNDFLKQWIRQFNRKFGNKTKVSVFEKAPSASQINLLLARVSKRIIDSGHQVGKINTLQKKSKALVIQAFDGDIYINIDEKIYVARKLLAHERQSKDFDLVAENKKKTQV